MNGTLSGTVLGGNIAYSSGGSGSTVRSTGSVLGASTIGVNSQTIELSPIGDIDGVNNFALNTIKTPQEVTTNTSLVTPIETSSQTAAVIGASSGFSFNSWFWIILLTLLLVVVLIYLYSQSSTRGKKSKQI